MSSAGQLSLVRSEVRTEVMCEVRTEVRSLRSCLRSRELFSMPSVHYRALAVWGSVLVKCVMKQLQSDRSGLFVPPDPAWCREESSLGLRTPLLCPTQTSD